MAVARMKKVVLVAPISDAPGIAETLQELGIVEVVREGSPAGDADSNEGSGNLAAQARGDRAPRLGDDRGFEEIDQRLAELKYCVEFFDRFEKVKKNLIQQFAGGKVPLPESSFEEYGRLYDEGHRVYEQCRRLDDELSRLHNDETRVRSTLKQLEPWAWLDVPLAKIAESRSYSLVLCEVPLRALDELVKRLEESCYAAHIERGPEDKRVVSAAVLCLASDRQRVIEALTEAGTSPAQLPALSGTAAQEIQACERELSRIADEKERILGEVRAVLSERVKILSLYDSLSLERERRLLERSCPATRTAFAVEGWIRAADLPTLEKTLTSKFGLVHMESRDPAEGEVPPVALENPGPVTPFEAVTEIYSMPQQGSIDPTFALAPFFFIFFGIALGDVGYGLGLTALSLLLLKKVKMAGLAKKLFTLLAICGVSSAIVGVLTGSWLGSLVRIPPLWFNPMDDPMLMLGVSFALGIIHIYVGLGIKFYSNVKHGRLLDALFDQGFWYVFLTGLLLLLGGSGLKNAGLTAAGQWTAVAGAVGLILTQGRAQKNPIRRLASGVLSLYGVTGYLSDVLSYSRLLALGLASSVIAVVIDDMALRMLGIPFVGWIPMILLLAIGHGFNLAINVVGSYVHSSRLQYVEFFSKFFEGGGRRFLPFRKRTRYIEVMEEGEA
ncbi:MAG: V-type ATP synthase subunit I [Betaproteobacteria bacterium]